jgi:hypothetical protein
MNCDDCLNLLEAYIDREASERETEMVQAHLLTCAKCSNEFDAITAERDLYARYDRELQISPAIWNGIAAQISTETESAPPQKRATGWLTGLFALPRLGFAFSGAVALVIVALVVGMVYWRTRPQVKQTTPLVAETQPANGTSSTTKGPDETIPVPPPKVEVVKPVEEAPVQVAAKSNQTGRKKAGAAESDVLFTDATYSDIADKDTTNHLQQAENLLVSVRSIDLSDDDKEVDVTYEKAESRRLLNENIVLRRDAEMAGKYPAKAMLGSLEPFLIDIANLPDKASADDVRQIKDRVQKTEIVAELRSY